MFRYALIDLNNQNRVIGVSSLAGETVLANLVALTDENPDSFYFGKAYENGQFVPAPITPVVPTTYTLFKSTPWMRMTSDEAERITGAMVLVEPRLKGIYDNVLSLNSGDPLWPVLHDLIATALSTDGGVTPNNARADELLAPET